MTFLRALLLFLVACTASGAAQSPEFRKDNRDRIVSTILAAVAKETGATTAMSDSGSGNPTSDMDVTSKMTLRRPDGSVDNDLTPYFFETAKKLYPDGDFELDEYGSIRSRKLDTAIHDAKNAVPDFRSAMSPEAFKVTFMDAIQAKERNPDAYFTAGGNKKQVEQRMQTKSRLRVFQPNGGTEEVTIDRTKPAEYAGAMKKYFGMNPDEVASRSHTRDLFGDAFDAYRQAREPAHENDPQNIRGDSKYNTRIVNNFLEASGMPPNWAKLSAEQKQTAMQRLFPDDAHAPGREKIIQVLDASFDIYKNRDLGGMVAPSDQSDSKAFSEMFQRAAIAAMAERRMADLFNPEVTLRDLRDNAQAIAQDAGKTWGELTKEERLKYLQDARQKTPELTDKLKFAAAGELAMVFKSLDGMDTDRAARLKEQIMNNVAPEQRPYVKSQLDLATAYLRDSSNKATNSGSALSGVKRALAKAKDQLGAGYEQGGKAMRAALNAGAATKQAYDQVQESWTNVKQNLDPSLKGMVSTLDKLDKTQSVLNLIKVYQDSNGDPDVMKRAVYMETMSRVVPGYDSFQMYKMWKSGDPQAQEQVQNSLVFQGLTMLPNGAIARGMKLAVDVAKTGMEVTIGYELNAMGDETVRKALTGGTFDSILRGVPGRTTEEQRKNLYGTWKTDLGLDVAFKRLDTQRKVWNNFLSYQKGDKANQDRYLRTLGAFHETVNKRIAGKVDEYLAGTTKGGEVATGAKEQLIQLLFADFVNGMNRELGDSLMKGVEREAAASQSVLEEADNALFGLFSKSLDAVIQKLTGADAAPTAKSRWDLRFAPGTKTVADTTRETTVAGAVRVVPPLDPTYEERTTTYSLMMPETKDLQTQIVNGRVKFRLRHPVSQAIVIEKEFNIGDTTGDGLIEREYWDADKKVLKREYAYFLEPGHVGGPAKIRNGMERVYYQSGKLSYEATRKDNELEGPMIRYWETGQQFDVATYKVGKRQGPYKAFHPNGTVRAAGQFIDDRKVGAWKTYHSNGVVESEGAYPDKAYADEPRGPGVPKLGLSEMPNTYANKGLYYDWGPQVGKWTIYYPSGKKQREETYGGPVSRRTYYDNDANSMKTEDLRSSSASWYENGRKQTEQAMEEGRAVTKDDKKVLPQRTYFNNKANSPESEETPMGTATWYENGQMKMKCPPIGPDRRYQGNCTSWNPDGTQIKIK